MVKLRVRPEITAGGTDGFSEIGVTITALGIESQS
jgi:hypothetical protein